MRYDEYDPIIRRLAAMFPQRPIGDETFAVYWEMLGDMDADVFAIAVKQAALHAEWFPTIHAIASAADRILTAAGMLPPTPEMAWGTVLRLSQRWGDGSALRNHTTDETLIYAVGMVGGVMRVALADDYTTRQIEKDFAAIYAPLRERAIREQGLLRLGLPKLDAIGAANAVLSALR